MKSSTLELAMAKAESLPEPAQEQIGRDVLLRIEYLEELRREIQVGVDEADAGQAHPLDFDALKAEARRRYEGS